MRKFSKLLAAVLTVCLLCGMVLPFAALASVDSGSGNDVDTTVHNVTSAAEIPTTLASGDTINTKVSITDYTPTTGLMNFKVVCEGGAIFTLSEDGAAEYSVTKSGNTYYCTTKNVSNTLNVTNHAKNFSSDFNTSDSAFYIKGANNFYITGAARAYEDGHYRFYGKNGPYGYNGYNNTPSAVHGSFIAFGNGASYKPQDGLSNATVDFDYGTDRYYFEYTANVVRKLDVTAKAEQGSFKPTEWQSSYDSTDLGTITLYKLVETEAEYLDYLANPSKLEGEFVYKNNDPNGYWYGTQTDVVSNVAVKEGSLTMAYTSPSVYYTQNTNSKTFEAFKVGYDAEKGLYYAYLTANGPKAYLSNELGVSDHVTVVLFEYFYNTTGTQKNDWMKFATYVNGQWLGTGTYDTKPERSTVVYGVGALKNNTEMVKENYSITIDNLAFNMYEDATYPMGSDITKLGSTKNPGISVTDCTDVVYSKDYVTPGSKWISTDDFKTVTFNIPAALASLTNGAAVITPASLTAVTPKSGLTNFKVVCLDGATFTLSDAGAAEYSVFQSGNTYYCATKAATNNLSVTQNDWNFSSDFNSGNTGWTTSGANNHFKTGIGLAYTSGYYRIYAQPGDMGYESSTAAHGAVVALSSPKKIKFENNAFATLDFDYATDRYYFTYKADVERTITATGSSSAYTPSSTESLKGVTLSKLVESEAEYLDYLANPSKLEGEFTYTKTSVVGASTWKGVQKDDVSNVEVNPGSLTPAYTAPQFMFYRGDSTKKPDIFKVGYDAGKDLYYAYLTDNGPKAYLSNELGVADHITVVIYDPDYNSGNSATKDNWMNFATYVNGQWIGIGTYDAKPSQEATFYGVGVLTAKENLRNNNFSLMIDNIAFNVYDNAVAVESNVNKLASRTNPGITVYDCDNVVYNKDYVTPGANWTSLDGFKTITYNTAAVGEAVTEGANIITTAALTGLNPKAGLRNFKIECFGDAVVTLGEEGAKNYSVTESDGTYYFVNNGSVNDYNLTGNAANYALFNTNDTTITASANLKRFNDKYMTGMGYSSNLGYMRIYGKPGEQGYDRSITQKAFGVGVGGANVLVSGKAGNEYITLDFDYGTDRYYFTYQANVTRSHVRSGSNTSTEWLPSSETPTVLENYTMYKFVSSAAEYEYYLKNPTELEGTFTYTNKIASWEGLTYTQTEKVENVTVNKDSLTLAYTAPEYINTKKGTYYAKDIFSVGYEEETGLYYAYVTDYASNVSKVYLSNEIGVTDHVTAVIFDFYHDETAANYKAAQLYMAIYINGEFLGAKITEMHSSDESYFQGIGVTRVKADVMVENYSLMLDNIALNVYDKEAAKAAGIDKLCAKNNTSSTGESVYDCTNVVYGKDYLGHGAKWGSVDGFKTVTTVPGCFDNGLTDGGTLLTNANLNYKPTVNNFTFAPVAGSEISFLIPYVAKENADGTFACKKADVEIYSNLDLATDMKFNLYIPNTLTNITVDGISDLANFNKYGIDAKVYSWATTLSSFDTKTVIVNATYTDETGSYDITFPVVLDVVKYASIVAGGTDATEVTLAKEIVDYKLAVATYLNPNFKIETVPSVVAFINTYGYSTVSAPSAPAATGSGIEVGYSINEQDGTISLNIIGATAKPTVTYEDGNYVVNEVTVIETENGYVATGIKAAYIDNVMTITVGDNVVTYSLANYISACGDIEDLANAKLLAEALLEYAIAAGNYKETPLD